MAKKRMQLVDSSVQKEVSTYITREVSPQFSCLITLTGVKTSPDLKVCNVYISVLGGDSQKEAVIEYLEAEKQEIFQYVSSRIRMKYIPTMHFFLDETAERAQHITSVLDSLEVPPEEEEED